MNNQILNFSSFRLNESTYTEFHVNFKDDLFKSKVIKEISMRKLQIVDEHGYVFKFKPDMYEDYNEIQFASSYDLRCGLDIYKPDTMIPGYNIAGNAEVLYEEEVPVPHEIFTKRLEEDAVIFANLALKKIHAMTREDALVNGIRNIADQMGSISDLMNDVLNYLQPEKRLLQLIIKVDPMVVVEFMPKLATVLGDKEEVLNLIEDESLRRKISLAVRSKKMFGI